MKARLTFVHALSPLHAGIGQGSGVIDLPIAREKATALPFLPGSSLKGALRTRCQLQELKECTQIFGPDTVDAESSASSALFSDQRLLFLPIRSVAGIFAWVTSPYVLQRFARDLVDVQREPPTQNIPQVSNLKQCLVAAEGRILIPMDQKMVYLEDFDLQASIHPDLQAWAGWFGEQIFPGDAAWQTGFTERICLVHDDTFHFMSENMTEITTRIRLQEESKTVTDGGLWYEEALPTETILSGLSFVTRAKAITLSDDEIFKALEGLTKTTLQLGGKATVGRGMCRVRIV